MFSPKIPNLTPSVIAEEIYSQNDLQFQKYLFRRWESDPREQGMIYRKDVREFYLDQVERYLSGWVNSYLSSGDHIPDAKSLSSDSSGEEGESGTPELDQSKISELDQIIEDIYRRIEHKYDLSPESKSS